MKKKITLITVPILIIIVIGFILFSNTPEQKAISTANNFINYLSEENFFEMEKISFIPAVDLIEEYVGVNIISYNRKKIWQREVYHKVEIENLRLIELMDTTDEENDIIYQQMVKKLKPEYVQDFEKEKDKIKEQYSDYKVITDDSYKLVVESLNDKVMELNVTYDVKYSNYLGVAKRNSVIVTVIQDEPDSKKLVVKNITGIIN